MKKILFVLLAFCATQLMAQSEKEIASFEKKIAKSDEDITDPKKGLDPKTWMNRGDLFVEIYDAPRKGLMANMMQIMVKRDERSTSDMVDIKGTSYEVWRYPNKDLYFDAGKLVCWDIQDKVVANPLQRAYEAYNKAVELDEKKSNSKKLKTEITDVNNRLITEAQCAYNIGKYDKALEYFEAAVACTSNPVVNIVDTLVIYNTGLTALVAGKGEKALPYFEKSIAIGFHQEGNAYANYAKIYQDKGDTTKAMTILEEGFTKYPENQQILVTLINNYLGQGKDMNKVLELIHQAQENDPNNVSLYLVESNVYEQIGQKDKGLEALKKAVQIAPNNYLAQYSLGVYYYNNGADIQNKINEDINMKMEETERLTKLAETEYDKSLPYFLKAYELKPDDTRVVESLRMYYFRSRFKSPEMMEKYEFYKKMLESM